MSLIHPTPVHMRHCILDELSKADREWQAQGMEPFPYYTIAEAITRGMRRANIEHEQGK